MMKTASVFLVAGLLGAAFSATPPKRDPSPSPAHARSRIGIYHWDGIVANGMSEGVERIASLGARIARVTLSPAYLTEYRVGKGCYPAYSLPGLLQVPDVRNALGNTRIRVMMLTAYDGVTLGDCGPKRYLQPAFFTPENIARIESEYETFTLELFRAFHGTGKTFILSNWESDNDLYCGSMYSYVVTPDFRKQCDAAYAASETKTVQNAFAALRQWFIARERGIARGKRLASSRHLRGVRIEQAPEFNSVRILTEAGFASVLWNILPDIGSRYVSYSSYESIAKPDAAGELATDLNAIRRILPKSRIIIGEAGFPRSHWKDEVLPRTRAVHKAALASGVAYYIQWNLYDQSETENLGLYDTKGIVTPLGAYYIDLFGKRR